MELEMDGGYLTGNPKDRRTRKTALKGSAIKFTKIVSLVGIRHATDSRNSSIRRIIWVAWLVFGFAFAVYQIQERLSQYFRYPSNTEIKIVTDDPKILFPQVTICCDNQIMASKARERDLFNNIAFAENTMQRVRLYEERPTLTNASRLREIASKQLKEYIKEVDKGTNNWVTLSKELALPATEAVKQIHFNNTLLNSTDMEEIVTDVGHCYAFSTKQRPFYVSKPGPVNGLRMTLNSPSLQIIPSVRFLATKESLPGFRILIHDQDELPRMKDAGFSVKPGKLVRVTIEFENTTQQGEPYGKCNESDPNYRSANCLAKCDHNLFVKRCRCKNIYMTDAELNKTEYCTYGQILNCTWFYSNLTDVLKWQKSNETCICSQQCHRRVYKTVITQTQMTFVSQEFSVQTDDLMQLEIYYPQMSYMEAKSVGSYMRMKLLCDIGNALSLLLGATLLTIYEASEFLLLFIKDYLRFQFTK